jgi:hypothetical protein
MNSGAAVFLVGLALTSVLSFIVALYLNRHIRNLLTDLCGTQERADFWRAFTNVVLFLFPLLFVLNYRPDDILWIWNLSSELMRGLLGLVMTVLVLGIVIVFTVPPRQTRSPSPQ